MQQQCQKLFSKFPRFFLEIIDIEFSRALLVSPSKWVFKKRSARAAWTSTITWPKSKDIELVLLSSLSSCIRNTISCPMLDVWSIFVLLQEVGCKLQQNTCPFLTSSLVKFPFRNKITPVKAWILSRLNPFLMS